MKREGRGGRVKEGKWGGTLSSPGNGLYLIELLAKGVLFEPQTTQAIVKVIIGCSLTN